MEGNNNKTRIDKSRDGTNDIGDGQDTAQQKGNVNIIDETKVENGIKNEAKTSDFDETAFRFRGNINVINETKTKTNLKEKAITNDKDCRATGNVNTTDKIKVKSGLKRKGRKNIEIDRSDSNDGTEDEDDNQLEKNQNTKEKMTIKGEVREDRYHLDFDDSNTSTDSDQSLEKGNEYLNENLHLSQTHCKTSKVNTNQQTVRKPGDNMLKIKTAVKSLQTALEILEKNDHTQKVPLRNLETNSNAESHTQTYTTKYVPFRVNQDKSLPVELESSTASCKEKQSKAYLCNFCHITAKFTCKRCKYFYCYGCRLSVHPKRGPFMSHEVIKITDSVEIEQHETCKEHGLVAQLFCSYCQEKRCAECANTKCFLHFKGKVSRSDIDREKALLVEELERVSTKLAFLGRYKDFVENECDKIEMTGLLRKEQIRQEFVSFHDLLINKEAEMLAVLDHDVQERQDHIRDTLQASVLDLEKEDALLTTTVTDLVQSEDDNQFIEECVNAKELCCQIDEKISKFNKDWANNSKYSRSQIFDNPFSMLKEKKQLLEKLNSAVSFVPEVTFVQTTLYLCVGLEPLHICEFVRAPVAPPSTEVEYTFQLSTFHGKVVYQKEVKDLKVISLNTEETVKFESGDQYLVKISPTYRYVGSQFDQCLEKGDSAHMLIVVGRRPRFRKRSKERGSCIKNPDISHNIYRRAIARPI